MRYRADKTLTLTVDGDQMTVSTMKSRVIDVVHENGLDVGERDDLYPAGDQDVHPSDTIVLRRSRPVQISLDGQNSREGVDHGAHGPGSVDAVVDDRHRTRGRIAWQPRPLEGMSLPVVSAKTVQLDDGGAVRP